MGVSHFDEKRAIGMGQVALFYGDRAQFIVLAVVFSHGCHRFVVYSLNQVIFQLLFLRNQYSWYRKYCYKEQVIL